MNERKVKILGIVVYYSLNVSSGWMFSEGSIQVTLLLMLSALVSLVIQWELSHKLHLYFRKKYSDLSLFTKRIGFVLIWVFTITFLIQLLSDLLLDPLITRNPFPFNFFRIISLALQSFAFCITSIGLFEASYNFRKFRNSEIEKEELMRLNLKSKLESLKNQVNPHFLFNSLNTLSSLIHKDAEKAEEFVEELSNVYRFLLRTNEQELNSLRDELEFIKSYGHLLITRFGTNLTIDTDVDGSYLDYYLPSLTLQLLVENAVKHNVISAERPLTIKILCKEGKLVVENNLQKKKREVFSEKTGLTNIISKYRLLKQPEVNIQETVDKFVVVLPLQKSKRYEGIDR